MLVVASTLLSVPPLLSCRPFRPVLLLVLVAAGFGCSDRAVAPASLVPPDVGSSEPDTVTIAPEGGIEIPTGDAAPDGEEPDGMASSPRCGDGVVQGLEVCDRLDVAGATCNDLGFTAGALLCAPDCTAFDTRECSRCGNGLLEPGEACDGLEIAGAACEDFGFAAGPVRCAPDCQSLELGGCGGCGNGVLEPGEVCDGQDLGGATCSQQGFTAGRLRCSVDCMRLVTDECTVCGNGVREGDEACDGDDLAGQSCGSLGRAGRDPRCDASCTGFDVSPCGPAEWTCVADLWGDGRCDCGCGTPDPDCGGQTDSAACEFCDRGSCAFAGDTEDCGAILSGDNTACAVCGDGLVEANEVCDGPPQDADCTNRGFVSGSLGCSDECDQHDVSACLLPQGWTCPAQWLGDGACDCGCGAFDAADCTDRSVDACDHCAWGCGRNCFDIDPVDNSQCRVAPEG